MDIIRDLIQTSNASRLKVRIVNNNGIFGVVATNETTPTLPTEIAAPSAMPTAISVVGATSGTIGTTERVISFPYSGTAATKDYSFTTTENLICDILVVGGGGSGGRSGGGGGTVLYTTNVYFPTGGYTLKVGNGGISTKTGYGYANVGIDGNDSEIVFGGITIFRAKGGGGGGGLNDNTAGRTGGSSGGGESSSSTPSSLNIISTNTSSSTFTTLTNQSPNGSTIRGNIGGIGFTTSASATGNYMGGGGGGAGGAGGTGNTITSGAGGSGINNSITNTTIMYGSGGSAGVYNQSFGASITIAGAVSSGGGTGAYSTSSSGTGVAAGATISGTGGGGGGGTASGSVQFYPSDGGSGIVIIRYRKPSSEIVVSSTIAGTTDRYISFPYTGTATTKDYTITTTEALSCDILVVGGGGGGGNVDAGGGGAGACIVALNQSFAAGNYTIRVGNGGIGGILSSTGIITRLSTDGVNSSILNSSSVEIYRAVGGGRAGGLVSSGAQSEYVGKTGGCGGGAGFWQGGSGVSGGAYSTLNIVNGVSNISPSVSTTYGVYGNVGGNSVFWNNSYANANGGGGGGIGAVGANGVIGRSGAGGNGLAQVTINSTQFNFKTYFAPDWNSFGVISGGLYYIGGGGGGGGYANANVGAKISGGLGGGGTGDQARINADYTDAPTDGIANTGSGGGGACGNAGASGGAGGSGIIIIRYRKAINTVTNTLFSILNGGVISTSTNVYSNIIINVDTSNTSSAGISSQWTSNITNIYYNTSNVGIGTLDPVAPLHIYNNTTNRLLLDTTTTGTPSIEFRRGVSADTQNDFRIINDTSPANGTIKILCENSTQSYNDTTANLAWFSSNETIIHKNTSMNGRVGIGTVYHSTNATRSLDVLGDANISGAVSVGGLSVSGSGSSGVTAIISNSLTSNTSLTIRNGMIPPSITSSPVATTTGTTGAFTYQVFTYTTETAGAGTGQSLYTLTVGTGGAVCDILIVGGGGAGGAFGGGGGAGQVLYGTNVFINSGTVNINVGNGGATTTGLNVSQNGFSSSITIGGITYSSVGGGGGGGRNSANFSVIVNGNNGGSGGGGNTPDGSSGAIGGVGGSSTKTSYSGWISYGNSGGYGIIYDSTIGCHLGGGGGGAGGSGGSAVLPRTSGSYGGIGVDFSSIFGTSVGESGWFGGGGGGVIYGTGSGGLGGTGGGGKGAQWSPNTPNGVGGTVNTGGGGGGGGLTSGYGYGTGGKGGSGIIIIRYLTSTSSSINLVRGTAGDANRDYKLGNYNAEFKVLSSVSNTDTDYIKITTAGAITNPTGTASWNTGSDRRIKENIERASYDKCFDNINRLELNRFNYIDGFNTVSRDRAQLGFIAQEVKDIFPKSISTQGYYSDSLNIPDLLSIDISQINYSLYGAVKKLIELNKEDKEKLASLDNRIKTITNFLNISLDTSNIVIDTSNIVIDSSNIVIDSSNIVIDSSNIAIDSSNIAIDTSNLLDTSNIAIDTSNIAIDTSNLLDTSNITIDTSNIAIDTSNLLDTSNITIDTSNITIDTSNIAIDTSNLLDTSNIAIDTSNIAIDTSNLLDTSNITIDTSNIAIDTSNIAIDTSNLLDTSNITIE